MIFDSRSRFRQRRAEIRRNRPPAESPWRKVQASGAIPAATVAAAFFIAITVILMMREDVIPYQEGQYVSHDITARVDFQYADPDRLREIQENRRRSEPSVYQRVPGDYWGTLAEKLLLLPDMAAHHTMDELPAAMQKVLTPGEVSALQTVRRQTYISTVNRYINTLKSKLGADGGPPLVILPADQRNEELDACEQRGDDSICYVTLAPPQTDPTLPPTPPGQAPLDEEVHTVNVATGVYGTDLPPEVLQQLQDDAREFPLSLKPLIGRLAFDYLRHHPTHELDQAATEAAQERAAASVPETAALVPYAQDSVIVPKGIITDHAIAILRAENEAYLQSLGNGRLEQIIGIILTAFVITLLLAAYTVRYQPRIKRNTARALALAALLTSMLLISALAGAVSDSPYIWGIAPTILAAIILTIAYDQRFAMGVGSIHSVLVTLALAEGAGFFLILWVGVMVTCYLLDDIRTRSKLIEVGGAAALAMMFVSAAVGALSLDPSRYLWHNCLYVGAAGLAAGFVTLGILPFVEKAFRITTSMTLLELADASQPLLRRLALEAPGTYNHSIQVATLAEAAAEAIGANSLACRVGAYYHDVGKINKADYFAENQPGGTPSRHLNLSPNVSLLIILGHVKDGMELAREYNLPSSLLPFIQQHHGTTLVEYFYNEACKQTGQEAVSPVPEEQYRYPGPKPKSRETAILMIADCVESACRAMRDPSASGVDRLVSDLIRRRLDDGQFDECDLTLRDIERIQRSMSKTLLGIYHGRIAYPSTSNLPTAAAENRGSDAGAGPAVKSA
ncbi:MAG TPA: HDIG domain-containing protein [Tepidisphaeraceae bacterium]|nr:HDIG domain-containing protein [Tepidisphaeraceae bacterium]